MDRPDDVERLADSLQSQNEQWLNPDVIEAHVALRAYADLLRRVEQVRRRLNTIGVWSPGLTDVLALLDGEPGAAR